MTMKEVRAALEGVVADGVSKNKAGNFVARKGYFYHHGQSSETFAAKVAAALPKAIILNKWDHMAAFRGGASLSKSSHFGVEFKF